MEVVGALDDAIREDLQMTNEELQKEMIAAMKAKDKVRLSIIRQA